jgi:hypothetical protein
MSQRSFIRVIVLVISRFGHPESVFSDVDPPLSARVQLSFGVTHGQTPNQLPPTELLGLWRCEGYFATAIGLLNTAPFGRLQHTAHGKFADVVRSPDFIESAIEMSAACCRVGVPRSSGLEVRDRFVDLLP